MQLLDFERDWLQTIFETILPADADETFQLGARDVPMDRFIDELLAIAPLHFSAGIRIATWAVWFSPPLFLRKLATIGGLSVEDRERLFERMAEHPNYLIRELPMLFKTAGCLGFCGLPTVQAQIGITPRDGVPAAWARQVRDGVVAWAQQGAPA